MAELESHRLLTSESNKDKKINTSTEIPSYLDIYAQQRCTKNA